MFIVLFIGAAILVSSLFFPHKYVGVIASLACFAWYFNVWEDHLVQFVVFSIGALLVILEMYLPNTGFAGIVGAGTMAIALVWATGSWLTAALLMLGMGAVVVLVLLAFAKMGRSLSIHQQLVLQTQIGSQTQVETVSQDDVTLLQAQGVALTDLKPVGTVEIATVTYSVTSTGRFIAQGEPIVVVRVENGKIYVKGGQE